MREILFRGQHRRYGEKVNTAGDKLPAIWVYGGVFQGKGGRSLIYGSTSHDGEFEGKYPVYTDTLGQFTGLLDKNGKKIFEGDIVRYTNHVEDIYHEEIGVCVFEQLESNFCLHRTVRNPANYPVPKTTHTVYLISNVEYEASYEIIGNIHDNPELLGGAE